MGVPVVRAIRRAVLAAAIAGAFVLPATGRAAACSALDLSCPTTSSSGPVREVTDSVGETVSGVGDTGAGAVGDAAKTATGAVGDAADEVTGAVDRVLHGGDGGTPHPPGDSGSGGHRRTHPSGGTHVPRRTSTMHIARIGIHRVPAGSSSGSLVPGADVVAPSVTRTPVGFFGSPAGQLVIRIAKRLAFPLALLLLILGFVFVQHRIDRRAPKIARAAVRRDIVRFS